MCFCKYGQNSCKTINNIVSIELKILMDSDNVAITMFLTEWISNTNICKETESFRKVGSSYPSTPRENNQILLLVCTQECAIYIQYDWLLYFLCVSVRLELQACLCTLWWAERRQRYYSSVTPLISFLIFIFSFNLPDGPQKCHIYRPLSAQARTVNFNVVFVAPHSVLRWVMTCLDTHTRDK